MVSTVGDFAHTRVARIAVVCLGCGLLASLALVWRVEREQAMRDLGHRLELAATKPVNSMTEALDQGRTLVRFLANVPPVRGLVRATHGAGFDALGQSSAEMWKTRLAEIFDSALRSNPEVQQARYIGVANGGMEIVRVERSGGQVLRVPPEALQPKGDQPYFQATLARAPGEIYLSDLSLNRERGTIQWPHIPTVRVSVPVPDQDGEIFGMMVVNLDLSARLAAVERGVPAGLTVYVTNQAGDFLAHPDGERTFGFDKGKRHRFQQDFRRQQADDALSRYAGPDGFVRATRRKVFLDEADPSRFLQCIVTASEGSVKARVLERLAQTALMILGIGGAALTLLFFYWVSMRDRLRVKTEQQRLATIVDSSGDATLGISAAGVIETWNRAAQRMFGYVAEQARGRTFDDLLPTEDGQRLTLPIERRCPEIEQRRRHMDGRWLDVSLVASPLLDAQGLTVGAAIVMRDVSEQKAAQKRIIELNESLERQVAERTHRLEEASMLQRSILAHAGYAIIATDTSGIITLFNPAAEKMLGYSADEVVRRENLALFHDPEELAASAAEIEVFLDLKVESDVHALFGRVARATVDEKRWTYICKDGSVLPVQLSLSALKNESGQTVGYLCIAVDYTEIATREQALRQARAEAVSASRAKSQFLANMSHEIRTPMNAILGTLELIRRTPPGRQRLKHVDIAESAARTMLGVIEDILDFSKIEAGKLELTRRAFDLDSMLRGTAGILSLSVGSKPLRLVFDVDPRLPKVVVGDALRLQQVLLNLTGNAIKFTPKGHVTVSVGCRRLSRGDLQLRVSVRDDGVGMTEEQLSRVFDSFEQAELSTTRRFGGTGLGLAISRHLVAEMGGELKAESEPGRGSTFHFTARLQRAHASDSKMVGIPSIRPRLSLRVLVVDELREAREAYAKQMQSLGWPHDTATSLPEARDLATRAKQASRPYDVFIVHAASTGDDSRAVALELHGLGSTEPATVVISSTVHSAQMLQAWAPGAFAGVLVEPTTASMVFDVITQAHVPTTDHEPATLSSTPERLRGIRVLLVEDNPLNQQIASQLLVSEGASVTVANDGTCALTRLEEAPRGFDVVLMDLHMPNLDGFSTTRRIRRELGLTELPIIAMTANTTRADGEACRSAGMNDHIGKPFQLDDLVRRLLQYSRGTTIRPPAHTSVPAPPDCAFDLATALARFGGKRGPWLCSLREFCANYGNFSETLARLMRATDKSAARDQLHALKGVAGMLGAVALARDAKSLEQALRDGEDGEQLLELLHDDLEATLRTFEAELHVKYDPDHSGTVRIPTGEIDLEEHLRHLSELLSACDMGAMDLFQSLSPTLQFMDAERQARLDAALSRLDFATANEACTELRRKVAS